MLSRIAALVSKGDPCTYNHFDFQVHADLSALRLLNPMNKTCRKLREASCIAIGGLSYQDIRPAISTADAAESPVGTSEPAYHKHLISIESVLALPWLAELTIDLNHVERPDKEIVFELVQKTSRLMRLDISGENKEDPSFAKITRIASTSTLQVLRLSKFKDEDEVERILSFQYKSLTRLHLPPELKRLVPEHIPETLVSCIPSFITFSL